MSTTPLDKNSYPELQPAHGLWQLYQPEKAPYRFQATERVGAETWQQSARRALRQTIGFQEIHPAPLQATKIETVDKGAYVREKWILPTFPGALMPFYLLIPKHGSPPYPCAVAFHGHGYGVMDIVGLWEDGEERSTPEGYHKDFAVELCRKGFLVAAPEISCFGERQTDFSHLDIASGQEVPTTCDHTAKLAFHLGGSVVGLRVYDALRLIDYLESRGDIDIRRLGAMGISGGGMHTLFSTCLDERIRACVISGYYSTFKDSILAMSHCTCNFVPGLHQFGEMYDLIGLVAPRPLLVEAGSRDPLFPISAVQRSVEITRRVYAIFDSSDQIETDFFEGRHAISGKRAYDFLWEKLYA